MTYQPRVQRGIPTGGQFAGRDRAEATITISGPTELRRTDPLTAARANPRLGYLLVLDKGTSGDIVERVAVETKSDIVKLDALRHPNATPRMVNRLARDPYALIANTARRHPLYSPDTARERVAAAFDRFVRGARSVPAAA